MNFFAHQQRARRDTRRMLVLFALVVLGVVAATDVVLLLTLGHAGGVRPQGVLMLSALVAALIAVGSLYRTATLRAGGAAVAAGLGGVMVPTDTSHFAWRRLRNVVEEIAIASGVPVPQVFVLEEETGINAFAAGFTPADAAITVTRGALDKLTRAELQGVIGHKFSHILNGDMRLNIRLVGMVFGILALATIGRRIAQDSGRGRRAGMAAVVGLALFAVGYIGVVLARVIQASISRQREYLADASAVQFTRQTEGIAGALKKIGALAEGSKLASSNSDEVAHMLFSDGVGRRPWLATHPPLVDRIRRLDPAFAVGEWQVIAEAWSQPVAAADAAARDDVSIAGLAPRASVARPARGPVDALPDHAVRVRVTPRGVAAQVGNPGNDDSVAARRLRAALPPRLRLAARDGERAVPLLFALSAGEDAAVRARQLQLVADAWGPVIADLTAELASAVATLHPMQRLPLAALAFPALRRRPRPQLDRFMATLRALIDADGRVTLGEYCLATLVRVQVIDALDPTAAFVIGRRRLPQLAGALHDLLAILARHGHADEARARQAFGLGLHEVLPDARIDYRPPDDWKAALDRALPQLDLLLPVGKECLVQALVRVISADGLVTLAEAELLRTVCAALHCPLPPLLQQPA